MTETPRSNSESAPLCSHFTAWSYEQNDETLWAWSCDCGMDGTAGQWVSLLDALDGAQKAHRTDGVK